MRALREKESGRRSKMFWDRRLACLSVRTCMVWWWMNERGTGRQRENLGLDGTARGQGWIVVVDRGGRGSAVRPLKQHPAPSTQHPVAQHTPQQAYTGRTLARHHTFLHPSWPSAPHIRSWWAAVEVGWAGLGWLGGLWATCVALPAVCTTEAGQWGSPASCS
jgi:hypothetical protein